MLIDSLPNLPGLARHGAPVRRAFVSTVALLGWRQDQADALAALIEHESGWRADAVNAATGASGLIQFMPSTARHLGTTVEDIRDMDAVEQLYLVRRYFAHFGANLAARDVPVAAFLPAMVGKPDEEPAGVKGAEGLPGKVYAQNAALDRDNDGRITLGEVRRDVFKALDAAAGRPRLPVDGGGSGGPAAEPTTPAPPAGGTAGGTGGGAGGALVLLLVAAGVLLARRVLA